MSTLEKAKLLETLVEILEKSISETAKIERNKKVLDGDGVNREIDVYVEETLNKRTYITAIECKNYESPISVEKIDAFYSKCLRIPVINKKIYVTTSQYQKGAIEKAEKLGIELCRIKEITDKFRIQQFGTKGIASIRKKINIVNIGFDCKSIFDKTIALTNNHTLIHKGDILTKEMIKELVIREGSIWKFLESNNGLIFNHKKTTYPVYNVNGISAKINKQKIFPIEKLRLKVEIEFVYIENSVSSVKTYESNEGGSLVDFSQFEFYDGESVHKMEIVKKDEVYSIFAKNDKDKEYSKLSTIENVVEDFKIEKQKSIIIDNIKIKSHTFKVSNNCLDEVRANTEVSNKNVSKSSRFGRITKGEIFLGINENNKELFFMIPLDDKNRLVGHFPDPISLYMNNAIDFCNISENHKNLMTTAVDKNSKSLLFQDGDYYKYLQYRTSSIFMLRSAIELFVNSTIKDDFIFEEEYSKDDIINNFSIDDKISKILPLTTSFKILQNKKIVNNVIEVCSLSDDLQNLKTSDTIHYPYLEVFAKMIKLNLNEVINQVKLFMKKVNGYVFCDL